MAEDFDGHRVDLAKTYPLTIPARTIKVMTSALMMSLASALIETDGLSRREDRFSTFRIEGENTEANLMKQGWLITREMRGKHIEGQTPT